MGNFEDTANVTTPYTDVVKLTILQRRNDCIEAMEFFQKQNLQGYEPETHVFRSRLFSFWLEISSGYLESESKKKDSDLKIAEKILDENTDADKLIKLFSQLDQYIYRTRLTKIASFKAYDTTIAEAENEANEG